MDWKMNVAQGANWPIFGYGNNVQNPSSATNKFSWLGALSSGIGAASSIANFGLGIANLAYQKNLQKQIFAREDTAVQRRMADLKAAGINPYMAAGSAAGSGSVVSTSVPQYSGNGIGDYLDTKLALENIKQAQEMTKQAQWNTAMARNDYFISDNEKVLSGIDRELQTNLLKFYRGDYEGVGRKAQNPYIRTLYSDLAQYENAATIAEKQKNWFDVQQATDLISKFLGGGSAAANAVTSGIKNVEQSRNYRAGRNYAK